MVWANWITAREAKSNSKGRFHCSLVMRAWGECSWADQICVVFFVALGSPKSHRIPWVLTACMKSWLLMAVTVLSSLSEATALFSIGNLGDHEGKEVPPGAGCPAWEHIIPCFLNRTRLWNCFQRSPTVLHCTTVLFLVEKEAMSHTIAPPFPAVKKKPRRKASTGAIQATCPEQSVQWYNFRLISFQALWLGCAGFIAKNYYKDWFYRKLISNYRWTHWVRRGVGIQVKAFGNTSRILWSDWTYSGDACLARCFGSKYSFWGANLAPNAWDVFCIWLCIVS